MSNMSYCRFNNTLGDLRDCEENMDENAVSSESERKARFSLVKLCRKIADDYTDEDGNVTIEVTK